MRILLPLLLCAPALAQDGQQIPPALVGTGLDTAVYLFDKLGWPGLGVAVLLYMWRTRDRGGARWRGVPLVVQVEVTPETAYLVGQAVRGKRVPSELQRRRAAARKLLDESVEHSDDEETTTPTGAQS